MRLRVKVCVLRYDGLLVLLQAHCKLLQKIRFCAVSFLLVLLPNGFGHRINLVIVTLDRCLSLHCTDLCFAKITFLLLLSLRKPAQILIKTTSAAVS